MIHHPTSFGPRWGGLGTPNLSSLADIGAGGTSFGQTTTFGRPCRSDVPHGPRFGRRSAVGRPVDFRGPRCSCSPPSGPPRLDVRHLRHFRRLAVRARRPAARMRSDATIVGCRRGKVKLSSFGSLSSSSMGSKERPVGFLRTRTHEGRRAPSVLSCRGADLLVWLLLLVDTEGRVEQRLLADCLRSGFSLASSGYILRHRNISTRQLARRAI